MGLEESGRGAGACRGRSQRTSPLAPESGGRAAVQGSTQKWHHPGLQDSADPPPHPVEPSPPDPPPRRNRGQEELHSSPRASACPGDRSSRPFLSKHSSPLWGFRAQTGAGRHSLSAPCRPGPVLVRRQGWAPSRGTPCDPGSGGFTRGLARDALLAAARTGRGREHPHAHPGQWTARWNAVRPLKEGLQTELGVGAGGGECQVFYLML